MGLVRVHRVGIGVGVAAAAALLLWPRGVTHELAAAVRVELRSTTAYLRRALRSVLDSDDPDDGQRARRAALASRQVAEGEFGDLMNSRGSRHVPVDTWARLVAQPHAFILGGSWLLTAARQQGHPIVEHADAPAALRSAVASLRGLVDRVDVELPGRHESPSPPAPITEAALGAVRAELEVVVNDPVTRTSVTDRQLIALLWSYQWLRFTRQLQTSLEAPIHQVREGLDRAWWR